MSVWIVEHVSENGFHRVKHVFDVEKPARDFVKNSGYCSYRWCVTEWKVEHDSTDIDKEPSGCT